MRKAAKRMGREEKEKRKMKGKKGKKRGNAEEK